MKGSVVLERGMYGQWRLGGFGADCGGNAWEIGGDSVGVLLRASG